MLLNMVCDCLTCEKVRLIFWTKYILARNSITTLPKITIDQFQEISECRSVFRSTKIFENAIFAQSIYWMKIAKSERKKEKKESTLYFDIRISWRVHIFHDNWRGIRTFHFHMTPFMSIFLLSINEKCRPLCLYLFYKRTCF